MIEQIHSSATPELQSDSPAIDALLDRIVRSLMDISLGFDRWDEPYARGPGLYFLIEQGTLAEFAAPMGTNRWPVDDCPTVFADTAAFLETAQTVAMSCDGAIVVHSDGTIEEAMVRVDQLSPTESRRNDDLPYAEWMGTRHMSALEASTREEVVAAVTLSEENGRVTVFDNGTFEDYLRTSQTVD